MVDVGNFHIIGTIYGVFNIRVMGLFEKTQEISFVDAPLRWRTRVQKNCRLDSYGMFLLDYP
jgi:hypothetical protein